MSNDLRAQREHAGPVRCACVLNPGKLPLVPVGDTVTIPFCMRGEGAEFEGASCDTVDGRGDGCRWWYVNPWALSWSTIE